jgi:hypothetical protein
MLEDIDFQVSHMKELLYLDISDNRISSLGNKAVSQLDATFSASHKVTGNDKAKKIVLNIQSC